MTRGGPDLVLVTGMSGAGRSSVLNVLEDLGFEAVDNLPIGLIDRLAAAAREGEERAPIALGVDIRTRDFDPAAIEALQRRLGAGDGLKLRTLFLDCDDEQLIRRFAETRRRHPLAADRPVADGIKLERRALAALRDVADVVLDTTELTVWDLKHRIKTLFADPNAAEDGPTVTVMSFAFRRGVPREADTVFDVRFLDNPHYDPDLRPLTGLNGAVGAHIAADPDFEGFLAEATALLDRVLPRYEREGKSYLTIAVGCTGGRHRSVYTAERLADRLADAGRRVNRFHRDLPADERDAGPASEAKRDGIGKERV
ncbi:MAG: RNase adapter RapZ [Marivibrio sp.]|uniref:RNase adapter RapZ n=1 Tax=Marivibrio sp. TaxID=2039719 RepID=UPI0032EAF316